MEFRSELTMLRLTCQIFFFCLSPVIIAQDISVTTERISLLFIGDIMCHDDQIRSAKNVETGTYNFEEVFTHIKPEISAADIAIANFEVTLDGPPYRGYPQFSSPDEFAAACSNAGIGYLVNANNHSADRGKRGILNTIIKLDSMGIQHTGTFADKSRRDSIYPMLIKKKGVTFALLNYTYGTNSVAVPFPAIVNILDKDIITSDIEKTKELNPDLIILYLHWGTEYDSIPSIAQSDIAGYLFGLGVDLIIGSHPHVLQKMIWLPDTTRKKDEVIVYSLGNFVSNQRRSGTDGGAILKIEFEKQNGSLKVLTAGYYLTWVYIPEKGDIKNYFVLPCYRFENNPGFFCNETDYDQMKTFLKNSRRLLGGQNINIGEITMSPDNPEK